MYFVYLQPPETYLSPASYDHPAMCGNDKEYRSAIKASAFFRCKYMNEISFRKKY